MEIYSYRFFAMSSLTNLGNLKMFIISSISLDMNSALLSAAKK